MLSDPKTAIVKMSAPLIVAYLVSNLQLFIDSFWCSGLGPAAMSAISLSTPIYWIVVYVGNGIGVGVSAAVSRALGAKDKNRADGLARQSVLVMLLISLLVSAIMLVLCEPILRFIGGDADIGYRLDYVRPFVLFSYPLIMHGIFAGLMRAEGAAKKAMMLSATAAGINMVLDPLLIYVLDFGLMGSSLATVVSFSATTCVGFYLYLGGRMYVHPDFKRLRFDREQLADIFSVGIPHMFELILIPVLVIPQNSFIYDCGGSNGMIAYNYPYQFVMMAAIPSFAITAAMISVTSAAWGQNDPSKAREGYRFSLKLCLCIALVLAATIFVLADLLIDVFTHTEETRYLHEEMSHVLKIYCLIIPMMSCVCFGSSMLQSLKFAQYAMVTTLSREVLFIVFFYFASRVSMDAIYWSFVLVQLLAAVAMMAISRKSLKRRVERSTGASASAFRTSAGSR